MKIDIITIHMNFLSFPLLREKHQSKMHRNLQLRLGPEEFDKHSVVQNPDTRVKTDTQNIVVLLTSTVNINTQLMHLYQRNADARLVAYMKAIRRWLQETNFKIVLVENSGYSFPELAEFLDTYPDRLELITFCEYDEVEAEYLKRERDKGACELFAINYAAQHSRLIAESSFVIKVTARFFVPNLNEYLSRLQVHKYVALSQNDGHRCEMVGARKDHFSKIFNKSTINRRGKKENHVENIYWERVQSLPANSVLRCKEFVIEPTSRGGINEVYTTI